MGAGARRGFGSVRLARDLAGIERVVVGEPVSGRAADARATPSGSLPRRDGGRVIPTDTVYGLACDPGQRGGGAAAVRAERPPATRPAAVMFFALDSALRALPELGPSEQRGLGALLPGPLTLLLANRARRFPLACGPGRRVRRPRDCAFRCCRIGSPRCARSSARCCSRAPTSPAGPTRAAWPRSPLDARGRRPRARRRRAARRRLDRARPARLRALGRSGASCAPGRSGGARLSEVLVSC